jgi:transposase
MLSFCGIDVSKDRLDVIVLPEEQRSSVSNNRAGWADLVERRRGLLDRGDRPGGDTATGTRRTLRPPIELVERVRRNIAPACLAGRERWLRFPGSSGVLAETIRV